MKIRIIGLSVILSFLFSLLVFSPSHAIEEAAIEIQRPVPQNAVFSGAATYNIPIKTPPGRNGLQPDLALIYNSFQRNGWVGVGWDIDMGSIRRSTKRSVDYAANDFIYEKNGALKELLPRNTDWGPGYYGEKIEEGFSKYLYTPGQGWKVIARDGTQYYYGSLTASRQDSAGNIFRWCLDQVVDPNGNFMTLTYFKDQGEIYLDKIEYNGNRIQFIREGRNDVAVNFKMEVQQVKTAYRLDKIEIYAQEQPVREYDLTYVYGTTSKRSRLLQVQEIGSDGSSTLPPEVFNVYAGGDGTLGSQAGSALASNNGSLYAADINGDGLTDLVTMVIHEGGGIDHIYTRRSNGDGTFDSAIDFPTQLSYDSPYFFADVNGDGRADLISKTGFYNDSSENRLEITTRLGIGNGTFGSNIVVTLSANGYVDASIYPNVA